MLHMLLSIQASVSFPGFLGFLHYLNLSTRTKLKPHLLACISALALGLSNTLCADTITNNISTSLTSNMSTTITENVTNNLTHKVATSILAQ